MLGKNFYFNSFMQLTSSWNKYTLSSEKNKLYETVLNSSSDRRRGEKVITRGHYIGEVVDALSGIGEQVNMRTALGLTDLNRYMEDFFKEILNKALCFKLVNLNDDHVNAPGLDLIDTAAGVGFQITSEKTSSKVNQTLERILELDDPPQIVYVLIIGKKQNTYTLNEELCTEANFSEDNIWDITDVAEQLIGLPIVVLQSIYEYVAHELARIRIELEVPDIEGNYPTSISQFVEPVLVPKIGEFQLVKAFLVSREKSEEEHWPQTLYDLKAFVNQLRPLPRITREFYAFLLERRDDDDPDGYGGCTFNYNRLKRICRYTDMHEELELLEDAGLIRFAPAKHENDRFKVLIHGQGESGFTVVNLIEVASQHGISLHKAFTTLDFSLFDPGEHRTYNS